MQSEHIISQLKKRQRAIPYLFSPSNEEVYSPLWLACFTLDKLPPKVWNDPTLKFIDFACKSGIFLSEVIIRLMIGLKSWEPDDLKRREHILKNMVFGYAYTELGYKVTKKLLYGDSNYDCNNIKLKRFDTEDLTMIFDGKEINKLVIVGNPPYNLISKDGKKQVIWPSFVKKADELLGKYGGLSALIHPSNYRKPDDELGALIMANQIHYLGIYSIKDALKIFKCNMRFDVIVSEKMAPYTNTTIKDENGNVISVDLKGWDGIPNFDCQKHRQLFATDGDEVCDKIIYSSSMYSTDRYSTWKYAGEKPRCVSSKKVDEYDAPIAMRINDDGTIDIYYANKRTGHFNPKVICNLLENLRPYNDFQGMYGLNKQCFGIAISSKEEGDYIIHCLNTQKAKDFFKSITWDGYRINGDTLSKLKKDFWKLLI